MQKSIRPIAARKKIKSLAEIQRIVARAKSRGSKIVTTNGCFDLLHIGHIRNLETARSYGDMLIVGVNSDASVRSLKGRSRPILPARERAEIVAALGCVDYVLIFSEKDPRGWLSKIMPHIHAKGGDRAMKDIVERETVRKYGGQVRLVPLIKDRSTSWIIRTIVKRFS